MKRKLEIEYDKTRGILSYRVIQLESWEVVRQEEIPANPRQATRFLSGLLSGGVMSASESVSFYRKVVDLSHGKEIGEEARGDVEYFCRGTVTRTSESGGIFTNCDTTMALSLKNDLLQQVATPAR